MRLPLSILISITLLSCSKETEHWTNLLDANLSQWDSYLSYRHKEGYNGDQPKDDQGNLIEPIGSNKDQYGVFTVVEENNEQVLRVSGEIYGCISTKTEYENYHLRLKVKWGDNVHPPREKLLKDTGILYHSVGPNGAEYWRSWMLSQEFQIMQGHMGDYWSQATFCS
ncbi:family 16 glycoside hydrolase [Fulvivirga sp.]|uniref:family 16 glycoside hydrolase n=1 Tax=Fulvivirga sp. TaxID=1931237 RepID=UPI0032ECA473